MCAMCKGVRGCGPKCSQVCFVSDLWVAGPHLLLVYWINGVARWLRHKFQSIVCMLLFLCLC